MQLILDAENIDIERNMSTIEHEPLNEKFLANKVIDHLTDDTTTGNKENIQKQENIIQEEKIQEETNIVDTDKETPSGGDDISTSNPDADKTNEDTIDTTDVQTSEKNISETSTEKIPEQINDAVVSENVIEEEFPPKQNETKLEDTNTEDVREKDSKIENLNDFTSLDKNPIVEVSSTVEENNSFGESNEQNQDKKVELEDEVDNSDLSANSMEVSNERIEDKEVELDNEVDISELSAELNEENEMDLDKELDIAEISNELDEEKKMDSDKEDDDIAEVSLEVTEKNEIDLDKENDIVESSTELNEEKVMDLDKEDDIVEVPTGLTGEKAMDLDTEDDITEVSTGLNEEKEKVLEKVEDIVEVSTDVNNQNDIEVDIEKATAKDLEKDSVQNEVPNSILNDDSQEEDCSVIEPSHETNEKNTAIEIDDEDEKLSENNAESHENIEEVSKHVDKDKAEFTKEIDTASQEDTTINKASEEPVQPKRICRLSNNLDIFSDEEEDERPDEKSQSDNTQPVTEKQCINIDDDDDIMLIDEDLGAKDNKKEDTALEVSNTNIACNSVPSIPENTQNDLNPSIETKKGSDTTEITLPNIKENKDTVEPIKETSDVPVIETDNTVVDKSEDKEQIKKPLLPKNFLDTCKKNLTDMTRNDLEEFCILKIVESIVDRSNLGEIKAHLKNLTQTIEDCKKKCLILTKQNKDLQIVLKSVQDEQKSASDVHITPLKITRSVGMQVMMVADKNSQRRKTINGVAGSTLQGPIPNNNTKQVKIQQVQNTRNQKEKVPVNPQIPVPRLVPATPPQPKTNPCATNTPTKPVNNTVLPNGVRNSPPVQKVEKRPRSQAVTVDLTDDEPPAKLQNVQRGPVTPAMRVLTTGPNLVPTPRFAQNINSPRKVYIPISGPQAQNVRPGQTIMLKALSGLGPRPRTASPGLIPKAPTSNPMRFNRGQPSRHPAPLPDAMKQYQPPNWKSLPPAPDLKLSKVENGIVISWKIDGYQEDNHEEIASYQLYAYQETSSPPNTALWKKIGDVKALPLPMACTLTQFMAGYKYYFAVRAVDIRSRYGPFSLPGSILLLNKM